MAFNIDVAEKKFEKKLEGEWHTGSRTLVEVLVLPRYHPEVKKKVHQFERQVRNTYGLVGRRASDDLPPQAFEELIERIYCEGAVQDWKGVAVDEGDGEKLAAFTPDLCKRLMRVSPEFRQDLADLIDAVSALDGEDREAISGN